jgi:RHS repeat-associated protein
MLISRRRSLTFVTVRALAFLQNHLGSSVGLTNNSGSLSESNAYDSFGNPTNSSFSSRYQFTGREYDATTGLQFSRARWYDPVIGRFVSEDPIGFDGGDVNLYGYVSNNPQNFTDPSGLYEIDVHYYLTYYLAMQTGCFSQGQAVAIANADQMTDEDDDTEPGFNRRYANSHYHALNEDASPGVGSTSIGSSYINFKEFGQRLHYYQDTFSHAGFHNSIYGHASRLHLFDKTNSDLRRRNTDGGWNCRNVGGLWKKTWVQVSS